MTRNVVEIQQRLIDLGFLPPRNEQGERSDDGRFGERSMAAYNRFLASKGKPPHQGMILLAELNANLFPEEQPAPKPPKSNPLQDFFTGLAVKAVLNQLKGLPMPAFLTNGKTYVVGALMILVGLAEMFGMDVPYVEGADASRMIAEGFGFIFLRAGIAKIGQ